MAQDPTTLAWADSTLYALKGTVARDFDTTILVTDSLLVLFRADGDRCSMAEVQGIRSTSFTEAGVLDSALAAAHRVFDLFTTSCDSTILLRGYVALSRLHLALREYDKVDSVCTAGSALWRAHWEEPMLRNSLLTNKAIARARSGDLKGAEQTFRVILGYAVDGQIAQAIDDANTNLGVVKSIMGQLDSAVYYYNAALNNARENSKSGRMAAHYSNLASVREKQGDHYAAIDHLDSSLKYAQIASELAPQVRAHKGLGWNYNELGLYKDAFEHSLERFDLNDSLLNSEKVRALTEMQEKFESEKKAKEILELKADKLQGKLERSQVERSRNIALFAALGIVGLAFALWSRLRFVSRSRKEIQREKEISEGLLHNILPEEVAAEIKEKGYADADEFETATILFTDFKGFTAMSEKLSAAELVKEIDICFKAFDGIVEKYGIEKIKTIGDAYMAAGGLPDRSKGSPAATVQAALEMQEFMRGYRTEREVNGSLFFEMRLGIHTGPVIAGIVGVKKYAYDIWGDAVNTASRMESSGEIRQVNISQATYELVKNEPDLKFIPRGLIAAKGKGTMEMYFVHQSKGSSLT